MMGCPSQAYAKTVQFHSLLKGRNKCASSVINPPTLMSNTGAIILSRVV